MGDYITLMGAEQVQSAGNRISAAADDMRRTASHMESAFDQHQRFLDDWLVRLDTVLDAALLRLEALANKGG